MAETNNNSVIELMEPAFLSWLDAPNPRLPNTNESIPIFENVSMLQKFSLKIPLPNTKGLRTVAILRPKSSVGHTSLVRVDS